MSIKVKNIEWDCKDEGYSQEAIGLPRNVTIQNPAPELLVDAEGEAENICNYLSDRYGWCILAFDVEVA